MKIRRIEFLIEKMKLAANYVRSALYYEGYYVVIVIIIFKKLNIREGNLFYILRLKLKFFCSKVAA